MTKLNYNSIKYSTKDLDLLLDRIGESQFVLLGEAITRNSQNFTDGGRNIKTFDQGKEIFIYRGRGRFARLF